MMAQPEELDMQTVDTIPEMDENQEVTDTMEGLAKKGGIPLHYLSIDA